MKIFVSTDMEGTAGVVDWAQCRGPGAEYEYYRQLLLDEVNAAIQGALDSGATELLVNDSHSTMQNLHPGRLLGRARYLSGRHKPMYMMEGLDPSYDAVFLVSYHGSMAGAASTLSHTYNPRAISRVLLNGTEVGESGINALVAMGHGVPVVLVTGDDVAVKQVAEIATSAKTVAVKRAINPRAVELRPFKEAHADIERAARDGVAGSKKFPPRRESTYRVEVQFQDVAIPEVAESLPGMQRPAPDTIAFTQPTMPKAYTLIRLLYRYISPD